MKVDRVTYKSVIPAIYALNGVLSFILIFAFMIWLKKSFHFAPDKIIWIIVFYASWWLVSRPGKYLSTKTETVSICESSLNVSKAQNPLWKRKKDISIQLKQIKRYKHSHTVYVENLVIWQLDGSKMTLSARSNKEEFLEFYNSFDQTMREGDFPNLVLKPPFEKTKTALVMAWISGIILVLFVAAYFITKPKGANWGIILVSFISVWAFVRRVIRARREEQ